MTNLKSRQNSVSQKFYPHAFFFFLLTGATWYYHAIYTVFTGYEVDIFEVISNKHIQGSKFGGKSLKILNSAKFIEFVFSKSARI